MNTKNLNEMPKIDCPTVPVEIWGASPVANIIPIMMTINVSYQDSLLLYNSVKEHVENLIKEKLKVTDKD